MVAGLRPVLFSGRSWRTSPPARLLRMICPSRSPNSRIARCGPHASSTTRSEPRSDICSQTAGEAEDWPATRQASYVIEGAEPSPNLLLPLWLGGQGFYLFLPADRHRDDILSVDRIFIRSTERIWLFSYVLKK